MTTPSEFKSVKELRQIDDQGISPDFLMLFESENESLKVFLSQLASYIRKPLEDEVVPPGVPQYWPGDTPPPGFVFINNGLTFDIVKYPRLAIAWPAGIIPPHKGLVIECTADGAVTRNTEIGSVISHNHQGKAKSKDLGTVNTSENTHSHSNGGHGIGPDQLGVGWENPNTLEATEQDTGDYSHSHSIALGSHEHELEIENTGTSRNTVDRINYNIMVRLA